MFMMAIPKMLYGNLFVLPSISLRRRLRTAVILSIWGTRKLMRCPEVVVGILFNPVRADPTSAIVYRNLTDLRRLLGRSADLRANSVLVWLNLIFEDLMMLLFLALFMVLFPFLLVVVLVMNFALEVLLSLYMS